MSRWSEDSQPYRRARRAFLTEHPICWICGHPHANQIDHDPPQSLYHSRMDMDTWRPSHGPPGCPTCGRCCNQERGTRPLAALTPPTPCWCGANCAIHVDPVGL